MGFWCQRRDSNPYTGLTLFRILSPVCLPFHHSGQNEISILTVSGGMGKRKRL